MGEETVSPLQNGIINTHHKPIMKRSILLAGFLTALAANAADYSFTPAQQSELVELLNSGTLKPGDNVILKDGAYSNPGTITLDCRGTALDPITIKAEHPGKAVITGETELKISGKYIELKDLLFNKAFAKGLCIIELQGEEGKFGSHCRITGCVMDDCNHPDRSEKAVKGVKPISVSEYWIALHGDNNRVDHCYFANKRVGGLVIQVWLPDTNHINNHLIDHNFFGFRQPYGGNGAETIRIGNSWSSQLESRTVVENNVFLHCDGENEIISVKSGDNTVRNNLFFESRGGLVCRHGHNNILESNTIVGNNLPGTAGIRLVNQGHIVYDNYCARLGDFGLLVRMGVFERPTAETDLEKEPLTSYHRAENINITDNSFIDCKVIDLGSGYGDKAPRNVRLANNYFCNDSINIRIAKPEAVMPGLNFIDNRYFMANGDVINMKGFIRLTGKENSAEIEKSRVLNTLAKGIGASWYAPNNNDIKYIASKYQSK